MTRAVVLGGGFAGTLVAAVLARHVDDVTVVEGGRYPAGPGVRPGLPQAYHTHLLVTGGAQALETLLPGVRAALSDAGAHRRALPEAALVLSAEGWFHRLSTPAYLISCSRWLLDHVIRREVYRRGAITVRERSHVLGLVGDVSRVRGVVVRDDGGTATLAADLVVDATGRRSRAPSWLSALGGPAVDESTVDSGLAYSTRVYRAPTDLAASIPAVMLHPRATGDGPNHGATLFPIEDGRWIVTLTGMGGDRPPVDEQGFTDCVYALRSPIVAELLATAKPLGPVRPHRGTANRRRFFEHGPRPAGLLVLGDALMAVNPVHSHGMSIAALSALRVSEALAEHGPDPTVFPALQATVAGEADRSWRMAMAADSPARRPPTALERSLRARMNQAMIGNPVLMAEYYRAQTLMATEPLTGAAMAREIATPVAPALSADEAIAQHPVLAQWWLGR